MSFFQRIFQPKKPLANGKKKTQQQQKQQHQKRGQQSSGGGGDGRRAGQGSPLTEADVTIQPGYLQALLQGVSFRVAVIGDSGTGKSSLINRIAGNAWAPELRDVAGCQVSMVAACGGCVWWLRVMVVTVACGDGCVVARPSSVVRD